jgi:hypothetical protein
MPFPVSTVTAINILNACRTEKTVSPICTIERNSNADNMLIAVEKRLYQLFLEQGGITWRSTSGQQLKRPVHTVYRNYKRGTRRSKTTSPMLAIRHVKSQTANLNGKAEAT